MATRIGSYRIWAFSQTTSSYWQMHSSQHARASTEFRAPHCMYDRLKKIIHDSLIAISKYT